MTEDSDNKFYVYCHQTKDDGRCFYIGKGSGRRAWSNHGHSIYWERKVSKHGGFNVVILVNNITEKKAFELEKDFIKQIGRKNLVNLTEGGEGSSGYICTDDHRKKISKSHIGKVKSKEHLKKISDALTGEKNKMYGLFGKYNPYSKKVIQYQKDGILIKIWDSMSDIQRALNISISNISLCCTGKRKSAGGFIWSFINDNIKISPYKKETNSKRISQYSKFGEFIKTWESATKVQQELKIANSSISRCCNNKLEFAGGFIWKYHE